MLNPLTRRRLLQYWLGASLGLGGSALLMACSRDATVTTVPPATMAQARVRTVGTSSSAAASTAASTSPAAKAISVTWATWANPDWNNWEKDVAIPGFERANPAITVAWLNIPQPQLDTKLQTMQAGGTPADLWVPHANTGARGYAALGMVRDLTPYIQRDKVDMTVFDQPVRDLFTLQGHVIAMPYSVYGSFLFYNKDLLTKAGAPLPPANWDDRNWTVEAMRATALKLTRNPGQADAQYGVNGNGCVGQGVEGWLWAADPWSADGYTTGYPSRASFDSAGAQAAYTFFADLMFKDHVAPSANDVKTLGLAATQDPFVEQRLAMVLRGGFALTPFLKTVKFGLGIAAFPWSKANTNPLWPDSYLLAAKTKVPDQSWSLLSYLTSPEGLHGMLTSTGSPPANRTLLDAWYPTYTLLPKDELKQAFEGALQYGKPPLSHAFVDSIHLESVFNPILNNTLWQEQAAVSTALTNVQTGVAAALAPNVGKRVCVTGVC
jgi:multiple sugar transport system substrate-binding protein